MTDPIPLIVFGVGGNAVEIVETVRDINASGAGGPKYVCVGFLDDDQARRGQTVHGLPILGPVSSARDFPMCRFVNGIGGPSSYWLRPQIVRSSGVPAERFGTLVHPTATVASTARLKHGVVLFPHVVVGSNVTLEDHVLVLPTSVVSHDSTVGAHTCIAAGVCISAAVSVGTNCYLGTRCCIIGATRIGARALVGMGAAVLHDVESEVVVVGNPARFLHHVPVGPSAWAGWTR